MPRGRAPKASHPVPGAYPPYRGRREQHHQQRQHNHKQSQPQRLSGSHGWPYAAPEEPVTSARNTSPVPSSPPYSPPEVIGGEEALPTFPAEKTADRTNDSTREGSTLGGSRRERGNRQRSLSAPPPAGSRSRNMYYEDKADKPVLLGHEQESPLFRYLPGEFDEESEEAEDGGGKGHGGEALNGEGPRDQDGSKDKGLDKGKKMRKEAPVYIKEENGSDEETQVYRMESSYVNSEDMSNISSDVSNDCGDMLENGLLRASSQGQEVIEPRCGININQGGTEESFEEAIEAFRAVARTASPYRRENRQRGLMWVKRRERIPYVTPENNRETDVVPNENMGNLNGIVDTPHKYRDIHLGRGPIERAVMEERYKQKEYDQSPVRRRQCSAWGSPGFTPGQPLWPEYEKYPPEWEGPVGGSPLSRERAGHAADEPEMPSSLGAPHPPLMGNEPYHPQQSRYNRLLKPFIIDEGGLKFVCDCQCGNRNQVSIHVDALAYDSDGFEKETRHRRFRLPAFIVTGGGYREEQEVLTAVVVPSRVEPFFHMNQGYCGGSMKQRYDGAEPGNEVPALPGAPDPPQAPLHPQVPLDLQELQPPCAPIPSKSTPPNPPYEIRGPRYGTKRVAYNVHELDLMAKWGLDHIFNPGLDFYTVDEFGPNYLPPDLDSSLKDYLGICMKGMYFPTVRDLWLKSMTVLRGLLRWGPPGGDAETRKGMDAINAAIEYRMERDPTPPAQDNASAIAPEPGKTPQTPQTPRRVNKNEQNDRNETSGTPASGSGLIKCITELQGYLQTGGPQEDTMIRAVIEVFTAELERRSEMSGNVPAQDDLAATNPESEKGSRGSQVEAAELGRSSTLQPSSSLVSTPLRRTVRGEPNESTHRNHSSDSSRAGGNDDLMANEGTQLASEPAEVRGKKRRRESDGEGGGAAGAKRQRGGESRVGPSGMSESETSVHGRAKARKAPPNMKKKRSGGK